MNRELSQPEDGRYRAIKTHDAIFFTVQESFFELCKREDVMLFTKGNTPISATLFS
jgi:hypothetical protein